MKVYLLLPPEVEEHLLEYACPFLEIVLPEERTGEVVEVRSEEHSDAENSRVTYVELYVEVEPPVVMRVPETRYLLIVINERSIISAYEE